MSLVLQWLRTMVYENTYHENDVISKIFSGSLALLRNFAMNGQLKFVMLL